MKFKKGDNVIVTTGKNKGQKGQILVVLRDVNKVLVEGVNKVKKHIKPKTKDQKGTIVEQESPMNASNVMIVDPKTGKQSRIGKKKVGEKMVRIAKKSGQELK
jgi:large subunit ribosomal protein L24